jgi:hypothetical protein
MVAVDNFLLVEMTDVDFHTFGGFWLITFTIKAGFTMLESNLRGHH